MKSLKNVIIVLLGFGFLLACTKELRNPVLDMSQATPQEFTSPESGTTYVLTEDQKDSVFATFEWSEATYNISNLPATSYVLQMDLEGNNFADAIELAKITETTFQIMVGTMNQKVLALGPDTVVQRNIAFRILSYISTPSSYTNIYSDAIVVTVTPYMEVLSTASLWVPGDYQLWSPATAPKIYDFNSDGVYDGYIYIPDGGTFEFKFTSAPDWDHTNFGFGGDGILDTDPGAANLTFPGPGGYAVHVDTVNLTWSDTLQNWGVIGEWLGWSSDIDLIWDQDNQQLSVTVENIPAAANQRFKFRANDAWDINLGAKDPDDGTLVRNGADIPIPDGGTITFYLRFTTPEPTYEIQKK